LFTSACTMFLFFFFSSRRRHTRFSRDWSSDVCSSDLSMLVLSVAASLIWPERVEAPAPVRRTSAEPGQPGHRAAAADAEPAPDAGEAPDTFGSAGSGA